MAKALETKAMKDMHECALRQFDTIESALYQERRQSLEDRRFYSIAGAQWEGALEEQFINKPKFEVNKVHLAVIKIINEYRNNRVTVDFVSKDGTKDDKLADICDGLFRADEQDSTATEAYDNAFEEAVGGGFGAFRLITEYEDEEDDENDKQRIRIEPIYDADRSVFFDLDAKRQDKADAKHCFVTYTMTPEEYEEEWGKDPTSIHCDIDYIEYDWYTPDLVQIAEYYKVEMKKETVIVFKNNITGEEKKHLEEEFDDNEELSKELEATGWVETRRKKVKRKKIHKYIIDGNGVLEDCGIIAGKNIPIIPVYGKRWFVDSIERCMGHVRLVKDSQRLKNMQMSRLAEIAAMSAYEKPILTPDQVGEHGVMWAEDHIKNYPFLMLDPILDAEGNVQATGPTSYTKPPSIPPALAAVMQTTDVDMKELLGGSAETDKMLSHVSGKAHEMIQKRIDGQAFIYMSNFAKAIHRAGEVWLSMAKEVYVEEDRDMKTIDNMGEIGTVALMQPGFSPSGELTTVNDISKATFDVAVDVGPSSASQREATVNTVIGMLQIAQNPEDAQVLQAMALMNMEGDGIAPIREFYRKKLVQLGVVEPTEEEAQAMAEAAENAEPSPQETYLMAEASKAQAGAKKAEAEVFKVLADTEKTKAETLDTLDNINLKELQETRAFIDQQQRAAQAQQQMEMQRQAQLVQQNSGNMANNTMNTGENNRM